MTQRKFTVTAVSMSCFFCICILIRIRDDNFSVFYFMELVSYKIDPFKSRLVKNVIAEDSVRIAMELIQFTSKAIILDMHQRTTWIIPALT